jgi:glycosyltransferase involved in cell wall biosynthesis
MPKKSVLIITPSFRPNVGGAETYANELCEYLRHNNYYVYVLTFQPITSKAKGEKLEKLENMEIRRYWWLGHNLFHKLEKYPFLIFLYLSPYLFIRCFFWLLTNHKKIDVIDAQGLNSALVARVLKLIFKKRVIGSIMSLYDFVPDSSVANKVAWILNGLDHVIVESEASQKEINSIGVPIDKITPYVEWVDLDKFKPLNKKETKIRLNLPAKFTILFVARAIEIKGSDLLLDVAKKMESEDIFFVFISRDGPMVDILREAQKTMNNVVFIEGVDYGKLPEYYAAADVFVIPSKYSENAARTVVEAIACGTPVIGTNLGALPSLIDDTVGILVEPNVNSLETAVRKLYFDQEKIDQLTANTRPYALKNFSPQNVNVILNNY